MNRGLVAAPEGYKNFPRASGDEPCTKDLADIPYRIFPARVGMNPPWIWPCWPEPYFPRASGDEPVPPGKLICAYLIFPARVGMNRPVLTLVRL